MDQDRSSHHELDSGEPSIAAEQANLYAAIKAKEQTFDTAGTIGTAVSQKSRPKQFKNSSLRNSKRNSPKHKPETLQNSSRTQDKSVGNDSNDALFSGNTGMSEDGREQSPSTTQVERRLLANKKPLWLVNKKPTSRVVNHKQGLRNERRYKNEGGATSQSQNKSPTE
jgi:hypothetical protein